MADEREGRFSTGQEERPAAADEERDDFAEGQATVDERHADERPGDFAEGQETDPGNADASEPGGDFAEGQERDSD